MPLSILAGVPPGGLVSPVPPGPAGASLGGEHCTLVGCSKCSEMYQDHKIVKSSHALWFNKGVGSEKGVALLLALRCFIVLL